MKNAFGFAMAATMAIGGTASADILYHNPVGAGTAIDEEFGDFPTYSTYLVADINIPNPGFTITQVTAYFTINGAFGGVPTGRLHLFPKIGGLPVGSDDPAVSMSVPVSYDINTGILTTVGLNLDVPAGDYWIGLTPQAEFGVHGRVFHLGGVNVNGEIDAYRNPLGAFNFAAGTGWGHLTDWADQMSDIAITVEGDPIIAKCPWDLDKSGSVGTSDLLELFSQWGTDGPADFDESGAVGTGDLLILFANWGPCK